MINSCVTKKLSRSFFVLLVLLPTLLAGAALMSGCATKSKSNIQSGKSGSEDTEASEDGEEADSETVEKEPDSTVPVITQGEELEVIPIEINDNVHKWIKYFQGRGRPHMERYLARSTRYEALMKKVLRDNKLPEDLFYIALIESGFSSRARSHASAVGYWQFIRGTGKRYKLKIDQMTDERRDPEIATQAAADYFKDLYRITNSWYLSMASYNVGEGRVLRAVKKYKTNDFWELIKNRRALPAETDNYVPKYIAAKLIAKNPDKYGFDGIDYMPPIEFDYISFDKPVNLRTLAEKMNVNYEDFKDLNPKFKGEIAPLNEKGALELRIPPGTQEVAMLGFKDSVAEIVDFVPDQNEFQAYKVRKGDTFSSLARRFRTNIGYLREINDFGRKKKLRVGQRIYVPDRTPLNLKNKPRASEVVKQENQEAPLNLKFHVVKKGETLSSIATKYSVTVPEILKANDFTSKQVIKAGTKIKLPENAAVSAEDVSSSMKAKRHNRSVASHSKKVASKASVHKPTRKVASTPSSKKKKHVTKKAKNQINKTAQK